MANKVDIIIIYYVWVGAGRRILHVRLFFRFFVFARTDAAATRVKKACFFFSLALQPASVRALVLFLLCFLAQSLTSTIRYE